MRVEQAFQQAWDEASGAQRKALVEAVREARGWTVSYRNAYVRVLHMLDEEHPSVLPAYALELAIPAFGHARFLEPLQAAELRALRAAERKAKPARPERWRATA